jgi:hypothetical protein
MALRKALAELQNRVVSIFVDLPFDSLGRLRLQRRLDEIGQVRLDAGSAA